MEPVVDLETAHQGPAGDRFRKVLTVLAGAATLIAALLATLELHASKREERAFVLASRLSVELSGRIAGSSSRFSFESRSVRDAITRSLASPARLLANRERPASTRFQEALAEAEEGAAARLRRIAQETGSAPSEASGVDPYTRTVLATEVPQLQQLLAEQNRQLDVSQKYGGRESRALFALSLLALGAVLLGLAAVVGANRNGRLTLGLSATFLAVSSLLGISALSI